jgi:hypothetical protein
MGTYYPDRPTCHPKRERDTQVLSFFFIGTQEAGELRRPTDLGRWVADGGGRGGNAAA